MGRAGAIFSFLLTRIIFAFMNNHLAILVALGLAAVPANAWAGAANFTLVNKTGAAISSTSIRRSGTSAWKTLGGGASNGGRTSIAFSDTDCAFDIQAKLSDGQTVTYSGVNLCDVSTVTLNRSASGNQWVEYD